MIVLESYYVSTLPTSINEGNRNMLKVLNHRFQIDVESNENNVLSKSIDQVLVDGENKSNSLTKLFTVSLISCFYLDNSQRRAVTDCTTCQTSVVKY